MAVIMKTERGKDENDDDNDNGGYDVILCYW